MNSTLVLKPKRSKSLAASLTAGFAAANLAVVIALLGCQQDPFADKSEAIKQGVPPSLDLPVAAPKPIPSDALRISSESEVYNFKETFAGEITVAGRVLQGVPDFTLSIDNIDEFPGATFDAKTGSFKWTPPRDITGTDYGVPKALRVRLEATPTAGGAKQATTKDILIYVTRSEVDPEVTVVDDLVSMPTREGTLRKFEATLVDPDGADVDGSRPRLIAVPAVRGQSDISSLIYMDESTAAHPNPAFDSATKKWKFRMLLDLRTPTNQRGRDFTNKHATFKFALQAVSRFGRTSVKPVDAEILTDVLVPQVTWGDAIEIVSGVENTIQFTAFDPYSEGKVRVEFQTRVDQLPGGAVAFCTEGTRDGDMICTLSWKPLPVATKTDFEIKFKVINKSRVPGDNLTTEAPFTRIVTVKPGTPAPQPPPVKPPAPPAPSNPPVPPAAAPASNAPQATLLKKKV